MDKNIFNKLSIKEQVRFINNELSKNKSIRGITEEIGIAKSTLRDRFKRNNYIYDKEFNLYKSIENINKYDMTAYSDGSKHDGDIKKSTAEIEKGIANISRKTGSEALESEIDINTLYKLYKGLEKRIEAIEHIRENDSIDIIQFDDTAINRTYRVYESVQAEFKAFCKKHSKYTVTDIISTALYEYMNRNRGN